MSVQTTSPAPQASAAAAASSPIGPAPETRTVLPSTPPATTAVQRDRQWLGERRGAQRQPFRQRPDHAPLN